MLNAVEKVLHQCSVFQTAAFYIYGRYLTKRKLYWLLFAASIVISAIVIHTIRIKSKKAEYATHWRRYVTVQAIWQTKKNSFIIANVKVKVINRLPYVVEHARVLIKYGFESGYGFKSGIVDVFNIPANSFKIESASNSTYNGKPKTSIRYLKCTEIDLK